MVYVDRAGAAKKRLSPESQEGLDALVGKCDLLKVVSVIESGAFVHCGLDKDIFVPIGEQLPLMKKGESYVVYIYRDEKTGRVAASSRLNKYLYDDAHEDAREGDAVDLIICNQTALGYKAIVNNDFWGVLYSNEIFQKLEYGQKVEGYIRKIREDRRVDLCLQRPGYQGVVGISERILDHLKANNGVSPLTDKTPPEEIHRLFGVSKKKFKMAVGGLYKEKKVLIESTGIRLVSFLKKTVGRSVTP
jgi:predicted RNA-binding protein (virulence factor B family)